MTGMGLTPKLLAVAQVIQEMAGAADSAPRIIDLAAELDTGKGTAADYCRKLCERGVLRRGGHGRYLILRRVPEVSEFSVELTDAGRDAIARAEARNG